MKINVSKQSFNEALQCVAAAAPSRSTIPAVETTLLMAGDGRLSASVTDLDIHITRSVSADVTEDGSICLPTKRLQSVIRELPGETVEIVVENQAAAISSGRSRTKLLGLDASEFPKRDADDDFNDATTLSGKELQAALKQIAFSASTDESRYVLNGVLLENKGGESRLIATDGRRLTTVDMPGLPDGLTAILPNKTIAALLKTLGGEDVECRFGESFAEFHLSDTVLYSRLIVGTFPNWRAVMPASLGTTISIEREPLLAATKRVAIMANEKTNTIRLEFAQDSLTVAADAPDVGEARETIEIRCDFSATVAVNPLFLQQALQAVTADEITWEMGDGTSPLRISSHGWRYVLMPMRQQ